MEFLVEGARAFRWRCAGKGFVSTAKRWMAVPCAIMSCLGACAGTRTVPAETAPSPAKLDAAPAERASETRGSEQTSGASAALVATGASGENAKEPSALAVPSSCSSSEGPCTPDPKWVERLCNASYPSLALSLFSKNSPWTRGYLTRKTQAWNAAGGASEAVELAFDEEVLVLLQRTENTQGIQVSGASGGYQALRWDGTCVTLSKEELTLKRPPQPLAAKVEWRSLERTTRDALSNDDGIKRAYLERRNECKGASSGTVSLKCIKADTKLSLLIVNYVRNGGELGTPEKLP